MNDTIFRIEYSTEEEREQILLDNIDNLLIEEGNLHDGNYLVFSDRAQEKHIQFLQQQIEISIANQDVRITEISTELNDKVNPKTPDAVFVGLDIESTSLEDLKTKKIEQLNYFCNMTILNGFTSSCLGVENFYGFNQEDQSNINGQLNFINAGLTPEDESITWKASDSPRPHTVQQFKNMCVDAFSHKQNNIAKYWIKKYAILQMSTKEEVLAIVWD